MKRKLIIMAMVCASTSFMVPVYAGRLPDKPVTPVVRDGIQYSAPRDRQGFVVATWVKTKREIWSRQIYVIKHEYKLGLEEDVQMIFITSLELGEGVLKVRNEHGSEFELNLETLAVKVLKGTSVIDFTKTEDSRR